MRFCVAVLNPFLSGVLNFGVQIVAPLVPGSTCAASAAVIDALVRTTSEKPWTLIVRLCAMNGK
jgi:hypothetical protein